MCVLGIDIHHLIYELSIGIRLPDPEFCPRTIQSLLKNCFYAEPSQRPDFKEIKDALEASYHDMIAHANSNVNFAGNETHSLYMLPISPMNDKTMESRYVTMIKGNTEVYVQI